MLTTDKHGDSVRHNEKDSLWAVKCGSLQWSGWVNWYHHEFGKIFFPKWMTVPMEWPPTTDEGAATCAKWLSDIRDSKFGTDKAACSSKPVNSRPKPWDGSKSLPKGCVYPAIDSDGVIEA